MDQASNDGPSRRGVITAVEAWRLSTAGDGAAPISEQPEVAVEVPLVIEIKEVGSFTVLCSPGDSLALAAGFALAEGIISSGDDILLLQHCQDDPGTVRLQVADPGAAREAGRNLAVMSSCGLCGNERLDELLARLPFLEESFKVPIEALKVAVDALLDDQAAFARTGGTHAAGLFDQSGQLISVVEDVGRHNALDKAIGRRLLQGQPLAGLGAALSGRVSLEMVVKCAQAGLEVCAAVSAPTTLAIEAAQRTGVTLCAFVRETRATVFSHPARIVGLEEFGPC